MSKIINSNISKVKILALMLLILVSSILFAIQSQPVIHVTPDALVMKRESLELDPAFEEALNVSMKRGYCQSVNWEWAEVA
jgi:hypothetical protein